MYVPEYSVADQIPRCSQQVYPSRGLPFAQLVADVLENHQQYTVTEPHPAHAAEAPAENRSSQTEQHGQAGEAAQQKRGD